MVLFPVCFLFMIRGKLTRCIGPTSLPDQAKTRTIGIVPPSRSLTRPSSTKPRYRTKQVETWQRTLSSSAIREKPTRHIGQRFPSGQTNFRTKQALSNYHSFRPNIINNISIIRQTGQNLWSSTNKYHCQRRERTGWTNTHPINQAKKYKTPY